MDLLSLIISLLSGAAGGNIVGSLMNHRNMGTMANTLIGMLGGALGDFLLKAMGVIATTTAATTAAQQGAPVTTGEPTMDLAALITGILGSAISGGALTAIASLVKETMDKR